jgi:hypothetical protein
MTREEAITIIDNLHLIGCGRNQHEDDLKINIALDMAIEALQGDVIEFDFNKHKPRVRNKVYDERGFVKVVRCKDCRFNKHPSNDLCLIKKAGIYPDDDDFCSYGERREP